MYSLLGSGPSFPMNVSESKGLKYVSEVEKVNQSLFILFETPKGSRLMLPGYGSDIHKYRFDPLDNILMERLRHVITKDIRDWEPRINLLEVEFLSDPQSIDNSVLYINIRYNLINTDVQYNYVYPYRLEPYETNYQLGGSDDKYYI